MLQDVALEAEVAHGCPNRADAPIRTIAILMGIGIRVTTIPQIGAQVRKKTIGDVKMAPAAAITETLKILDPVQLKPIVKRGPSH